ncbi:hypothetical protein Ae201684P_019324 [Aphanomyces euteiches]|nr:hypothetical protein Ae201684P_019324 [Aphanomyces euteiches]
MLVLNQTPSETIGGIAPITAMTGSKPMSPLDLIPIPGSAEVVTLQELAEERAGHKSQEESPSKLNVTWRGPAQVVKAKSGWIFEIPNLITGIVREAHASRLKFYTDESLNVDEELLSHVAHNADGHVIDHLVDCRFNPKTAAFEVLVSWRGLQEIENSWEPATNLLEDIPVVLKRYVQEHGDKEVVSDMAAALGLDQVLGGIVANWTFAEALECFQETIQDSDHFNPTCAVIG